MNANVGSLSLLLLLLYYYFSFGSHFIFGQLLFWHFISEINMVANFYGNCYEKCYLKCHNNDSPRSVIL